MANKKPFPNPITILMYAILIAAALTWVLPAGEYDKLSLSKNNSFVMTSQGNAIDLPLTQKTLDSLNIQIPLEKFISGSIFKPVSVPNTFHFTERNSQGIIAVLMAPIKGIYEAIDIIVLILIIGGFINIFNETGALIKGVTYLANRMRGKESWLIIILTLLFSLGGSSYGMAEEGLVFYAVLAPLFLKAGYDLLVPVAVIFGGTSIGNLSSFTNPFATIIASNAAGISWTDGLEERIVMYVLATTLTIWYILRYAKKIKNKPSESLVYKTDGVVDTAFHLHADDDASHQTLTLKTKMMLGIFISTFLIMIAGVVVLKWWLPEMTALFLGSAILIGFIAKIKEGDFIKQFIKGAEMLLVAAFIVGVARGVTVILNEGRISDSILFYSSQFVAVLPPALFIIMLFALFIMLSLFISSSSGMAVLTMPILGALAVFVNVPGREIVNVYLFGIGIMGFLTPTGLILPSLALVNVSFKTWWRFIYPLILMLMLLCSAFLVISIYL